MRITGAKSKKGKKVTCPKCHYKWRTKQKKSPYVCCSRCKRYFKLKNEI